jgi:hypothetical protein
MSQRWKTDAERATTQNSKSGQEKIRDAIRHDADKPTPSTATSIVATQQKDVIFSADKPRDHIGHDAILTTGDPGNAIGQEVETNAERREAATNTILVENKTRDNTIFLAQMNFWMPMETTLENRPKRRAACHSKASKRRHI